MSELERAIQAATGYIGLGMLDDAWEELESLPPELRAHDAVMKVLEDAFFL